MSTLSKALGRLAEGHKIEHNGKTFEFRPPDLLMLEQFEKENYKAAREDLREYRDDYGPEEYVKRLDDLRERYAKHEFSYMAQTQRAGGDISCLVPILCLLTGASKADVADLLKHKLEEVVSMLQLVNEEALSGEAQPAGTPN